MEKEKLIRTELMYLIKSIWRRKKEKIDYY